MPSKKPSPATRDFWGRLPANAPSLPALLAASHSRREIATLLQGYAVKCNAALGTACSTGGACLTTNTLLSCCGTLCGVVSHGTRRLPTAHYLGIPPNIPMMLSSMDGGRSRILKYTIAMVSTNLAICTTTQEEVQSQANKNGRGQGGEGLRKTV